MLRLSVLAAFPTSCTCSVELIDSSSVVIVVVVHCDSLSVDDTTAYYNSGINNLMETDGRSVNSIKLIGRTCIWYLRDNIEILNKSMQLSDISSTCSYI